MELFALHTIPAMITPLAVLERVPVSLVGSNGNPAVSASLAHSLSTGHGLRPLVWCNAC